jgi:hypothetical protein
MAWKWDQSAGELSRDGVLVSRGYAGHGRGINNPSLQGAQAIGPIPRGMWTMTEIRDSSNTGPKTIVLVPKAGTDALGRSEFRIHGDNSLGNRSASHGCIILPRDVRLRIWSSGDRDLEVVE